MSLDSDVDSVYAPHTSSYTVLHKAALLTSVSSLSSSQAASFIPLHRPLRWNSGFLPFFVPTAPLHSAAQHGWSDAAAAQALGLKSSTTNSLLYNTLCC